MLAHVYISRYFFPSLFVGSLLFVHVKLRLSLYRPIKLPLDSKKKTTTLSLHNPDSALEIDCNFPNRQHHVAQRRIVADGNSEILLFH